MRKYFVGLPVVVVVALFAITGEMPVLEQHVSELLSAFSKFMFANVAPPWLLTFILGLGISIYGVLPVIRHFERRGNYKKFRQDIDRLRSTRSHFFRHLGSAYAKYKNQHPDLPDGHNNFIDALDYPGWLDGKAKDLGDIARQMIGSNPDCGWVFFQELYKDIETVRNRRTVSNFFDTFEDCDSFHRERQELVGFWDGVGRECRGLELPMYQVKAECNDRRREIKVLSYLSVALYLEINHVGPGAQFLYQLAYPLFVMETEIGPRQIPQPRRSAKS